MVVRKILFIILIIAFFQNSFSEELNSYEYIKLDIQNNVSFKIEKSNEMKINFFFVESHFFPNTIEGSQYLNDYESSAEKYEILNNSGNLAYRVSFDKNNLKNENHISNRFIIESIVSEPEVYKKVKYPLQSKQDIQEFLQFGQLIDTNDKIKQQASTLAQGEDDVYIIATKIAKWIKEDIEYNLSTVLENPDQKSSEVFTSKQGVCKEITNLYVSMMRSLGIPARVVSGFAYTQSEDVVDFIGSNWGGHAWAEVKIGEVWVPFDLTYDQYGFVDATHIVTSRSPFLESKGTSINSSGYGYDLVKGSLISKNSFEVVNKKENIFDQGFDIELEGPDNIGLDSYGYIKVKVKNTKDFYQVLFLRFAQIKGVEILDNMEKMEIFMPGEEKEIYFRYKLNNLEKGYVYNFPFTVYNDFYEKTYTVSAREDYLNIRKIALPEDKIKNYSYSSNPIEIDCNFIIEKDDNTILCSIKNKNNYEINNLKLCIDEESLCKNIDLKINEIQSVSFKTKDFEENLTYEKEDNISKINLKAKKPEIVLINKIIAENKVNIEYKVKNYMNGLLINVFDDKELIKTVSAKNNENFNIIINNYGKSNITLELDYFQRKMDEKSFEINISKNEIDNKIDRDNYNQNFIHRFWFWIKEVLSL